MQEAERSTARIAAIQGAPNPVIQDALEMTELKWITIQSGQRAFPI